MLHEIIYIKFLDGISDLVMGYIVDHTHSKWGKARPWIARLCIPLAVCTVLMFSVPSAFAGKAQIAYMFLTYNLVSTIFYTGINVPYATMQGLMTMTFVVLMIVFIVLNMFMFFVCQERVHEESAEDGENQISFIKGLAGLFKNKYWLLMVVSLFAMYFMMSCFFGSAVYFTMYNMGNDGYYAMVSNLLSIAQIVTLFITPFLMKKISKRYLFMTGMAIATVGCVLSGLTTSYSLICLSSIIKGIGFRCDGVTMFGCLQDAITYGEWYNGYGTAGMGNAASSFCMKVGSGVGTAALGWILAAGRFDAQLKVQSASALSSISIAFAWVPVITSVICMAFFNVDKYYAKVVEDLSQGKHRGE